MSTLSSEIVAVDVENTDDSDLIDADKDREFLTLCITAYFKARANVRSIRVEVYLEAPNIAKELPIDGPLQNKLF